ncbi:MAG TPA: PEP-CTERM sorting domain-containing protein [Pyrinomonadaceae bacterium]|nr:PEP-CTERM sorting domain-containing protein [Pyrinomonadaceae bacterium]
MRHLAYRPIAVMLCLMLAAAVPAHAGPVSFADVIQLIVVRQDGRVDMNLRLRSSAQEGQTPAAGGGASNSGGAGAKGSAVSAPASDSVATSIGTQDISATIETIDVGEVTGTICECGEILIPSDEVAGFPKWPLYALAAVPLFFLNGGGGNGGDTDSFSQPPPVVTIPNTPASTTPTPVLTPTPTPTLPPTQPIPEPTTLLLLGSSLLALGAEKRRRHVRRNRMTSAETEGGQSC